MYPEALHGPVAARDRPVGHHPGEHVRRLGHQRNEVPERVVRARGLGHRVVRLGLDGVHEVGKLHRVLDEEHRDVVSDQVPVAFVGIELHREAADVAHRVGRPALACDGREPDEHGRLLADLGKRCRLREGSDVVRALEEAVRSRAAGMNDSLRNALMIEVGDLLAKDEVLERGRPAQADLQRVLVVGDAHALIGRERLAAAIGADPVKRTDRRVHADRRPTRPDLGRRMWLRSRCCRWSPDQRVRPSCPARASATRRHARPACRRSTAWRRRRPRCLRTSRPERAVGPMARPADREAGRWMRPKPYRAACPGCRRCGEPAGQSDSCARAWRALKVNEPPQRQGMCRDAGLVLPTHAT